MTVSESFRTSHKLSGVSGTRATAHPSTGRPLASGAPVEVAHVLLAVSQHASPWSALTGWASVSVHEEGSVKIAHGVTIISVRQCCVQNSHHRGPSWTVHM